MKRAHAVALALAAAAGAAAAGRAGDPPLEGPRLDETLRRIVAAVAPAVVRVDVGREDPASDDPRRRLFADPESQRNGDEGSGTVIRPDGLILTHVSVVLARGARVTVATGSGRRLPAEVLARDPELDLALLKAETGDDPLPALRLGTTFGLGPGRLVLALGNPFGVARDARCAAAFGVVTALTKLDARELVYPGEVIVTDAAINPGNEGGPLVDVEGRLVGILAPLVRDRRSDTLHGIAIPVDAAIARLEALSKGGPPARLGILLEPRERDARGLKVVRVVPGSPAEKAGVREGDRLVSVDGAAIDAVAALTRALEGKNAGSSAKLVVERDGKRLELEAKLGEKP